MPVVACPATVIDASLEREWTFVIDPRKFDAWTDARFEVAEPDGPAHVGQCWRFATSAFGRRWRRLPVTMTVKSIASDRQCLGLDVVLPLFGIINDEYITLAPLADSRTRVQLN
jgi:hypothetical protein